MHPSNIGRVVYGDEQHVLFPCTAKATVELLNTHLNAINKSLLGMETLVVGNSDVLAKPICSLLQSYGATVTVCPSDAAKLSVYTRDARGSDHRYL